MHRIEIITKFKIGDEVYLVSDHGAVSKATITSFLIKTDKVFYGINSLEFISEDCAFATLEEVVVKIATIYNQFKAHKLASLDDEMNQRIRIAKDKFGASYENN